MIEYAMNIGFLTDIHEDFESLHQALAILEKEKCDRVICLGDIVGFAVPFYQHISSRDANECIRLVREHCSDAVAGNHDLYAIKKVPRHKAGFKYGENWYSLDYEIRAKRSRKKIWLYEDNELPCKLNDDSIAYLDSLPETAVVDLPEMPLFISHFCHPDFSGSSIHFPAEGFHLKNHFQTAEDHGCVLSFSGHGHPEGCLLTNIEKINSLGFGTYKIEYEQQWIVAPCIAKTSRKNGVLIFDSSELLLNVIPLVR